MEFTANLLDFAEMLACAVDLMERGSHHHGQRVAYIAFRLFEKVKPGHNPSDLVIASYLHDIGIESFMTKEKARKFHTDKEILWLHCHEGSVLVEMVDILKGIKPFILYHHTDYSEIQSSSLDVPLEAQIIHLADRIEVQIKPHRPVLTQIEDIVDTILKYKGSMFNPELVEAFLSLSIQESFWLDIVNEYQSAVEYIDFPSMDIKMNANDIRQFSHLCARIVDRKSPFTAQHSQRVASIAVKLAEFCGMRGQDLFFMEIAGLLHDLGKLAIPDTILHKHGKLTDEEYRVIKQHPYYTYCLIDRLNVMDKVRDWAAFHHERLDGSGYPFHLTAGQLDLGARVMAVADMVGAITEDRPYRAGYGEKETMDIMWREVKDNRVDGDVVDILGKHYGDIVCGG
ncbi:MAG: HD domain-containing protein [Clostridia bacterium]